MKKQGLTVLLFSFVTLFSSCNLVLYNQKKLTKKLDRNAISEKTFGNGTDTLHYFEGGTGETLLLIHGFGGDAQITWHESMLDLKDEYRLIVPDLLWFGQSHSTRVPNLLAQVTAITALLNEEGVNSFSVAGISYGGFVSLGLLYAHPNRVESICIIDSPGITYDATLLDTLCKQENVAAVEDIFVVKNPAQAQRLFNLAFYKDKKVPKKLLNDIYSVYFSQHHTQLAQLLVTLPEEQKEYLSKPLPKLKKATVIWGKHDDVFPVSEGRKLADYLNANFVIIPEAGHAPNVEQFDTFQKVLREWLGAK